MSDYDLRLLVSKTTELYLPELWASWRDVINEEVESLISDGMPWGEALAQVSASHEDSILIQAIDMQAEEDEERERDEEREKDYHLKTVAIEEAEEASHSIAEKCGCKLSPRRSGGSLYFYVANEDESILFTLRISDHYGRGWSEEQQCHHDAPDVNIVVDKQRDGTYGFSLSALKKKLEVSDE